MQAESIVPSPPAGLPALARAIHASPPTPSAGTAKQAPAAESGHAEPDQGLRSPLGIRWLLVAGASVVAVSVVRLVASEWNQLVPAIQFLLLVAGALGIFGAGDVIRHRLRLPVAGTGLLALYSVLVPLLAWAAGRQHLLGSVGGTLAAGLGIVALVAPLPRLLRRTLNYRGRWLVPALGVFLVAIPLLPHFDGALDRASRGSFFVGVAAVLGLLLRGATRHLNRELFHRDRLRTEQRPLHLLPFATLASFYLLACASLSGFGTLLAVPLAFVALAAIDTGEEIHHALGRALGAPLERWPVRSRALLATGFALLLSSLALVFLDPSGRGAAVVMTLVALRLLAWAGRYRNAAALGGGLLSSAFAYHLLPSLTPDALRQLYFSWLGVLGWSSTGAAIGLGDVGLLALLVAGGALFRRHWTPAMVRIHGVAVTMASFFALWPALGEPGALALLVLPVVTLLVMTLRLRSTPTILVGLHHALALGVLAWSRWLFGGQGSLFGETELVALALFDAGWLVLASRLFGRLPILPESTKTDPDTRTWHLPDTRTWHRLAMGPALLVAAGLCPWALAMSPWAGALVLAAAGVGALAAAQLPTMTGHDNEPFRIAGAVLLVLAAPCLLLLGGSKAGYWSVVQAGASSLVFAVVLRTLASRLFQSAEGSPPKDGARTVVFGAATFFALLAALLSLGANPLASATPWLPLVPAFLASAFFALLARENQNPTSSALVSAGLFVSAATATVHRLPHLTREIYCLGPGLALIALAALLRPRIGRVWSGRLFTGGAICLYAMPVWGLLGEIAWGWQVILLVFAVAFGALAFQARSRSLLLASSAALLIDLAFFLIELRQQAPSLVWVLGIVFGLALMATAALIEHRRESLLQRLRIWGDELRAWS